MRKANESAVRRGSRSINADDIFFLIRKHKDKLARLMDHLSWKDVRKTAKDSDGKGGDTADLGAVDDPLVGGEGAAGATGPAAVDTTKKIKRTKITLPWDVSSYYNQQLPERDDDDEVEEMNAATVERLRLADEQTKGMTKEEYVHFSECRQASFTFRKGKRFREWAGFAAETDGKPNDDIVDMLGYLMCEAVQRLTKEALKVKMEDDRAKSGNSDGAAQSLKRKRETGLFDAPADTKTPIGPVHIQEAYRRLQENPIPGQGPQPWFGGPRILHRRELQLVCHKKEMGVDLVLVCLIDP